MTDPAALLRQQEWESDEQYESRVEQAQESVARLEARREADHKIYLSVIGDENEHKHP